MNAVQRFFRRYVFSTIGIVLLFFGVNVLLFFAMILGGSASSSDHSISVQELSGRIAWQNGLWEMDDAGRQRLKENDAWAMLLDAEGNVVWEQDLPEDLPEHYTSGEVASFSRWYLSDYPVKVWTREDGGLLVLGFQPGSWIKYCLALEWPYFLVLVGGGAAIFLVNLILVVFLVLGNTRKVEKAMTPILQGIQDLSHGKPRHLEEKGELAEINEGLNRAAAYMSRKDNTRAEWIRGVSHDIRTPLSMVLGYASELEENSALSPEVRKQAGIIRREGEKMRRLISDLNLTTKLEYALQPLCVKQVDLVELCRQAVSEVLNSGLPGPYEIELSEAQPGRRVCLSGDEGLLLRMLDNLIWNSVLHNPQGCKIRVSVGMEKQDCVCTVADNGTGLAPLLLDALNEGQDIASTQTEGEHGLGLKLARQIARAHHGQIRFSDSAPQGLTVRVVFPAKAL